VTEIFFRYCIFSE